MKSDGKLRDDKRDGDDKSGGGDGATLVQRPLLRARVCSRLRRSSPRGSQTPTSARGSCRPPSPRRAATRRRSGGGLSRGFGAGHSTSQRALVSLPSSPSFGETSRLPERCEEYFALLETIVDAAAAAAVNSPAEAWAARRASRTRRRRPCSTGLSSSMELLLTTTTTTSLAAADVSFDKEGAGNAGGAAESPSGSFAACCCGPRGLRERGALEDLLAPSCCTRCGCRDVRPSRTPPTTMTTSTETTAWLRLRRRRSHRPPPVNARLDRRPDARCGVDRTSVGSRAEGGGGFAGPLLSALRPIHSPAGEAARWAEVWDIDADGEAAADDGYVGVVNLGCTAHGVVGAAVVRPARLGFRRGVMAAAGKGDHLPMRELQRCDLFDAGATREIWSTLRVGRGNFLTRFRRPPPCDRSCREQRDADAFRDPWQVRPLQLGQPHEQRDA